MNYEEKFVRRVMQSEAEIHKLYLKILEERIATNAFARDVFADFIPVPQRMRGAEDFYRQQVWNTAVRAMEEAWPTPEKDEIAAGAPPFFEQRRRSDCLLIVRRIDGDPELVAEEDEFLG